jgi:hypothetical protein
MAEWIRESRNARSILAVLFALALAVRIAIPTGFMPTAAPSGIVISVCTGMGEAKAIHPYEKDDDRAQHRTAESPCVFSAGLGGGYVPPEPTRPAPVVAPVSAAPASRAIADLTVHRLAAPPPPALGPPARVRAARRNA